MNKVNTIESDESLRANKFRLLSLFSDCSSANQKQKKRKLESLEREAGPYIDMSSGVVTACAKCEMLFKKIVLIHYFQKNDATAHVTFQTHSRLLRSGDRFIFLG